MNSISTYAETPVPASTKLPQHIGENILPNFPIFSRLLYLAGNRSSLAINDVTYGHQATYGQLLSDVLHLRNAIFHRLDADTQAKLLRGDRVCINLLAPGGYEFATAFLATVALGAVLVPISTAVPLEEALYFANTCQSVALLCSSKYAEFGQRLAQTIHTTRDPSFVSLSIRPEICKKLIPHDRIVVSSDHYLDYNGDGLAIFTSGTSGPPKCAVKRRSFIDMNAKAIADWYGLKEDDVVLHTLPVHHATGIGITFMPFLLAGATIEFQSSGFNAAEIWDRWRKGGLTVFSGVPTMYMRLMRHFEEVLSKGPQARSYVQAASAFRLMMCGTSALPFSLQMKWSKLLNGKRILERYGATEFSSVFSVRPGDSENPDGSVGKVFFGLEVKLSNGDEGEILVKSPHMFTEYMYDSEATAAAFTPNGFYRTGDIARKEGDYYFILGRASIDIIKSGGYKISALDIEREILNMPYISEVMVVGAEDEEFGQRVAAAIVLRDGVPPLTLEKLRMDLRERLAGYKMPTILRVVSELPKSSTGKVVKRLLKKELFPTGGHPGIQTWAFRRSKV
ncbi:hypothetical protein N7457_006182 [Penicillium paradoxum]|uniref:uncharacterized protein n=1 Tax=Penicillium paradoxum TaxID=176176 RepID=UPI002549A504|nr:uncharacterized protein N7457_006182 [Penicillium paradoxum]KAJ5781022.1 hypothetical protein N7457_006182 [Penicillium paradoxum]